MKMNQQRQNEFICRVVSLTTTRKTAQVSNGSAVNDEIQNITDTFRWLRNNSPQLNDLTKHELLKSGLIETCLWFSDSYFENRPLSRSILLQFLANFSANSETVQQYLIESFHNTLR